MASWKERGVVPDSDDEDVDDSQSTNGSEEASHRNDDMGQGDGIPAHGGPQYLKEQEGEGVGDDESEDEIMLLHNVATPESTIIHQFSNLIDGLNSSASAQNDGSGNNIQHVEKLPGSANLIPRAPYGETSFSGLKTYPAVSGSTAPLQQELVPVDDEVSTSYILFSSPLSSLSSTPTGSPIRELMNERVGFNATLSPTIPVLPESWEIPESNDAFKTGRFLRERRPIQLHPYILEGEKYRQSLKDRGLKPLKIAHVQEQAKRTENDLRGSQDSDFYAENESQLIFAEEDSQIPSSPRQPSPPAQFETLSSPSNDLLGFCSCEKTRK